MFMVPRMLGSFAPFDSCFGESRSNFVSQYRFGWSFKNPEWRAGRAAPWSSLFAHQRRRLLLAHQRDPSPWQIEKSKNMVPSAIV